MMIYLEGSGLDRRILFDPVPFYQKYPEQFNSMNKLRIFFDIIRKCSYDIKNAPRGSQHTVDLFTVCCEPMPAADGNYVAKRFATNGESHKRDSFSISTSNEQMGGSSKARIPSISSSQQRHSHSSCYPVSS